MCSGQQQSEGVQFGPKQLEDPSKIPIVVTVKAKKLFSVRVYFALVPVNYNISTVH